MIEVDVVARLRARIVASGVAASLCIGGVVGLVYNEPVPAAFVLFVAGVISITRMLFDVAEIHERELGDGERLFKRKGDD